MSSSSPFSLIFPNKNPVRFRDLSSSSESAILATAREVVWEYFFFIPNPTRPFLDLQERMGGGEGINSMGEMGGSRSVKKINREGIIISLSCHSRVSIDVNGNHRCQLRKF